MPTRSLWTRTLLVLGFAALMSGHSSAAEIAKPNEPIEPVKIAGTVVPATPMSAIKTDVVNFGELARKEALISQSMRPPVRPWVPNERDGEIDMERENEIGPPETSFKPVPIFPSVASPSPTSNFIGLDDIPMVDSSYIVIPPDVNGAVGLTKILQAMNNNVRVLDKATGATISTIGENTFWAGLGAAPNFFSDPRTVYDPINNRWILHNRTAFEDHPEPERRRHLVRLWLRS